MLAVYDDKIKFAVDIRLNLVAGGGILHRDCEEKLLNGGSKQDDI